MGEPEPSHDAVPDTVCVPVRLSGTFRLPLFVIAIVPLATVLPSTATA